MFSLRKNVNPHANPPETPSLPAQVSPLPEVDKISDPPVDDPPVDEVIPVVIPEDDFSQEYRENLKKFNSWVAAITQGIAPPDDPVFLELKQWLRDNFNSDYIVFF